MLASVHSFPRGVLWRWPQWYSAMRYVALLPRWVRELYCQTTYIHVSSNSCYNYIQVNGIPPSAWALETTTTTFSPFCHLWPKCKVMSSPLALKLMFGALLACHLCHGLVFTCKDTFYLIFLLHVQYL
jgi:hypothetical protein